RDLVRDVEDGLADGQSTCREVDVRPAQAEYLSAAHACGRGEPIRGTQRIVDYVEEESSQFFGGPRSHRLRSCGLSDLRRIGSVCDVSNDEVLSNRVGQCAM